MSSCGKRKVLVYGGRGALGRVFVSTLKKQHHTWVCSIGHGPNEEADENIIVPTNTQNMEVHDSLIQTRLTQLLRNGDKLDGVFNVAGGWAGGNAMSSDFVSSCDASWQQSVWTSVISASIASHHLKEGGVLVLMGALPAEQGTPGMMGYGMCKASVHQLTRSLGEEGSGLPRGSHTLCVLPGTLDTPSNRKCMPEADDRTWTPLEYLTHMFVAWLEKRGRPVTGSLVKLVTVNSVTSIQVL